MLRPFPRSLSALFPVLLPLSLAFSACASGDLGTATAATASSSASATSASSVAATGSGGSGGQGGATATGSGGADAGSVDKAGPCVGTFGQALTNSFGRLDGTVLAVVKPTDTQCPLPNNDHVILEVTMNGAAYRMVINVQSTFGDPNVQYLALAHALPAPGWAEGWHTGLALDYVADFGVHGNAFAPHPLAELSNIVADAITLGQKVSVYTQSSGGFSAHEIHRNDGKVDGAIVLDPEGAKSRALLFHFADQSF